MKVIFDKLAKLELDDAAQYYELQIPGLGLRFEEEVKRGIRRILEYPNAWALEKKMSEDMCCTNSLIKSSIRLKKNIFISWR